LGDPLDLGNELSYRIANIIRRDARPPGITTFFGEWLIYFIDSLVYRIAEFFGSSIMSLEMFSNN
jgi:hypothetical protein